MDDTEYKAPKGANLQYLLGKLRDDRFSTEYHFQDQMYDPRYGHHFPYFNIQTAKTMMLDPRISYGLSLIKGPIITYTKFFDSEEAESPSIHTAIVELNYHFPYAVTAKTPEIEKFIIDQLNRFWEVALSKVLTAVEWGYSASEVRFKRKKDGSVHFDNLFLYPAFGVQCVSRRQGIVGFVRNRDKNTYVPIGKGFWHVHKRERNHYYGESALKGAHIPWHETWTLGGARDIRRTWFFKNAYDGGELYYPEGSYQDANGNIVTHEDHAVRMLELKRSGSGMIFPSTKGLDGKRMWEYEPPKANVTPSGMEQYIQLLRDEELEGLGIPPEVVQSAGNDGMGSATGRMVPLMAFIASLTPIGTHVIGDFCEQILPLLLHFNGMEDDYTIRRIVPKTQENVNAEFEQANPDNGNPNPNPASKGNDDHQKKPQPIQKKTIQNNGKTG
jgi:hypothetical protein